MSNKVDLKCRRVLIAKSIQGPVIDSVIDNVEMPSDIFGTLASVDVELLLSGNGTYELLPCWVKDGETKPSVMNDAGLYRRITLDTADDYVRVVFNTLRLPKSPGSYELVLGWRHAQGPPNPIVVAFYNKDDDPEYEVSWSKATCFVKFSVYQGPEDDDGEIPAVSLDKLN